MSTLISNLLIPRLPNKKPEDIATEVLAYLLEAFPPCRSAFLSLVGAQATVSDVEINTQYPVNDGQPDLVLHVDGEQWMILIENKPWSRSSFTSKHEGSDQLKRYAKHLKESGFQKKTLCLLATNYNSNRLLEEAQFVPDDDITFVVITWEQVFEKLASACSEKPASDFLLKDLQAWMFPPVVEIPSEVLQDEGRIWENWTEIKTIIRQARNIAANDPSLSGFEFMSSPGQNPKPNADSMNYFGYYIKDKQSGLWSFFGANVSTRRFLKGQSLFVLQVRKGLYNTSSGKSTLEDFDILKRCGFEYDAPSPSRPWWEAAEYVHPLTDSSNGGTANPEALAKALAEILGKMSEAINKGSEA